MPCFGGMDNNGSHFLLIFYRALKFLGIVDHSCRDLFQVLDSLKNTKWIIY